MELLGPGPERVTVPPGYREVATAAHPLQFLPYQYEGFAEGERRGLRLGHPVRDLLFRRRQK